MKLFRNDFSRSDGCMSPLCERPTGRYDTPKLYMEKSDFARYRCDKIIFDGSSISNVSFERAALMFTSFLNVPRFTKVNFAYINGADANFSLVDLTLHTFRGAKLTRADFTWSFCDDVNFTDADLIGADMSHASLHNATLTREQLNKATSFTTTNFEGKTLCNPNLLVDNLVGCHSRNSTFIGKSSWIVKPPEAHIQALHSNNKCCYFVAISNTSQSVIMSQIVNISRYQRLIAHGKARVLVAMNAWNTSAVVYITAFEASKSSSNHTFSNSSSYAMLDSIVSNEQWVNNL